MGDNERTVVIQKMQKMLEDIGKELQKDNKLSIEQKLKQLNVILDTMKFLDTYDINVKILNEYWLDKNWKDKFKPNEER